uniref:Scavenger receptor cysteine rich family member with 4 domains n=1 Tax=Aotus nancymaae TaxID=37293 RepID=A0A2K5CBR5_AOTNA
MHKEAEMQIGPQPDEKGWGWRLGDGSAAPPLLPQALSFLLLLPLASALQPTPLPFPELRLVGGPSRCRGRLEVMHGGSWGSVCDDDWDVVDANVVCRQLGCGLALPVPRPLAFGQGRGPILLDNVECRGQEAALSECGSRGWGVHNCFHYEDVAVLCDEFLPTQPPTRKMLTSRAPPRTLPNGKKLRLVGGPSRCRGRLEVMHGGSWGSVCDDDWDVVDANVVCRQLGCGLALPVPRPLAFGQGRGPILLDNVECRGQEAALSECGSRGWGVHNCFHYEDVAVLCDGECSPRTWGDRPTAEASGRYALPPLLSPGEGSVRLVGGANPCQGRVEILHGGLWGTVCDDDWGLPDAAVVCRQLGCGAAMAATTNAFFGYVLLDNVGCAGTEARLSDCFHLGWGQHNCGHHEDAGALCSGPEELGLQVQQDGSETTRVPTPRPRDGHLRLVNGAHRCEGRVELYLGQRWGTVCDDAWDLRAAGVLCRQLGCGQALAAPGEAHFGPGRGPILLDNVKCRGEESALLLCSHIRWDAHNCDHSEDASVLCQPS